MIDNFNKYLIIHKELQDRVNNNILTVEEAESVNDLAYNKYVVEKKTKEEYGERSFKKKYKFIPDKPGARTGTILIDGKRQKVDFQKSDYMHIKNIPGEKQKMYRQTSATFTDKDGLINLDRNYFRVKGSKSNQRRDALLQHEIGHNRLHNYHPESKVVDKNRMSPLTQKKTIDAVYGNVGVKPSDINKEYYSAYKSYMNYDKTNKDILKNTPKENRQLRNKGIKDAEKYIPSKFNTHLNTQEIEADRYSANRTSESAMKRGIKNCYRLNKVYKNKRELSKASGIPVNDITDDMLNQARKIYQKSKEDDIKQRNKALKDKELRKNKIYK